MEIPNNRYSFVLLSCNQREIVSIIDEIRAVPSVYDVRQVEGFYDIIVKLKASNQIIKEIVRTKIRYINGIRSTLTLFGTS